jgi:excisionase family DNA binding protein
MAVAGLHTLPDCGRGAVRGTTKDAENWLLPQEAADRLGISGSTLARWGTDELIPYTVTHGGHRRYLKLDVEALKEKLTKQSRGRPRQASD